MDPQNEIVMYLVFREDLKMTKGKVAAQAGHAVQLVIEKLRDTCGPESVLPRDSDRVFEDWGNFVQWKLNSYTKVAVKVPDWSAFTELCADLHFDEVTYAVVTDEGRTNVAPGSVTCLAIAPMPRDVAVKYVGKLKLY